MLALPDTLGVAHLPTPRLLAAELFNDMSLVFGGMVKDASNYNNTRLLVGIVRPFGIGELHHGLLRWFPRGASMSTHRACAACRMCTALAAGRWRWRHALVGSCRRWWRKPRTAHKPVIRLAYQAFPSGSTPYRQAQPVAYMCSQLHDQVDEVRLSLTPPSTAGSWTSAPIGSAPSRAAVRAVDTPVPGGLSSWGCRRRQRGPGRTQRNGRSPTSRAVRQSALPPRSPRRRTTACSLRCRRAA